MSATSVLANWTDVEQSVGAFGASTFAIEGAALQKNGDWASYASHNSSAGELAAELDFGNAATRVSPGMVLGAKYKVRLTADSTVDGRLNVSPADVGTSALGSFMETKTVASHRDAACDASTFNHPESRDVANDGSSFRLTPGSEHEFCILVKFAETNAQGERMTQGLSAEANRVTWRFTAASDI